MNDEYEYEYDDEYEYEYEYDDEIDKDEKYTYGNDHEDLEHSDVLYENLYDLVDSIGKSIIKIKFNYYRLLNMKNVIPDDCDEVLIHDVSVILKKFKDILDNFERPPV